MEIFHSEGITEEDTSGTEELDYVVNYISTQINNGKPVMVHCSGGKGRTGTILAGYLKSLSAEKAVYKIRSLRGESIQSKEQKTLLFNFENYLKNTDNVV